jgi:hypothetical protein
MAQTKNIALRPILAKDLEDIERIVPSQIDMRNVRNTDAGNVKKRNGYTEKWDTTAEHPIKVLIPRDRGYAIDAYGSLYRFGVDSAGDANAIKIASLAAISSIPRWSEYAGKIYILYGSSPISVKGGVVNLVGNGMPNGRFIAQVGGRTVISGQHPTRFDWSGADDPEDWVITVGGAGFSNIEKVSSIKNMIEYNKSLYFFGDEDIEVHAFTGTTTLPFRLQLGLNINKGLGAVESVVKANDKFYWFGHDGDFYEYSGGVPVVISDSIRARLDEMNSPEELIGYDIRKENLIMWVNPVDGVTFLYDYAKNRWLEDNRWERGWQAMPFLSYMEHNRKQYFGSSNCDGKIHEWSKDNKDDNGQPIRVYRRLKAVLSPRNHRVRVDIMRLRRKGAVATSSVTAPVFTVRWRFDKGRWSTKQLTMGAVGQHDPYVDLRRLGMGRELELEISEADATDFILTDIFVTYQELGV